MAAVVMVVKVSLFAAAEPHVVMVVKVMFAACRRV
jgi:hypothetical protein